MDGCAWRGSTRESGVCRIEGVQSDGKLSGHDGNKGHGFTLNESVAASKHIDGSTAMVL